MSMYDLTGWRSLSCGQRELVVTAMELTGGKRPVSSLTDLDGTFGPPVIFTEWESEDGRTLLRDYLDRPFTDSANCSHWISKPPAKDGDQ